MATKTYRITAEGEGNTNVIISATGGQHSAPTSASVSVQCDIPPEGVYGVYWDGTSRTDWQRTDNGVGITEPVAAVNNGSGSSPFDYVSPWKDIARVSDSTAGELVSIPKFYYKLTQVENGMKIQICDTAHSEYALENGYSVSPAHMNRGDGEGERNTVYVGRYHCARNTYKSTSNANMTTYETIGEYAGKVHNLGENIYALDFATMFTVWLLYLVEYADWRIDTKIGNGGYSTSGSGYPTSGRTDNMAYHTGTRGATRDTLDSVQYRCIELVQFDAIEGAYYNSNGMNIILNPANFSHTTGGVSVGTPTNGYPSKFTIKNVTGAFPMFIPSESQGSNSTYSCALWYFNSANSYLTTAILGSAIRGGAKGAISIPSSWQVDSGIYGVGARLMKLP